MSRAYREGHDRIFGGRTVVNRDEDESGFVVAGYALGMPVVLDPTMPGDSVEIRSVSQVARWDPVNGCVVWEDTFSGLGCDGTRDGDSVSEAL